MRRSFNPFVRRAACGWGVSGLAQCHSVVLTNHEDILLVEMKAVLKFLTQVVGQIFAAELPCLGLERHVLTAKSLVHEKGN